MLFIYKSISMKYYFTFILLVIVTTISFGQKGLSSRYFIKYSPLSLLDPTTPSIQFALEQRITEKYSMHYDLGYINSQQSFFLVSQGGPARGYRSRVEFRIYHKAFAIKKVNFFYGPNLIAKQVFQERERFVCVTPDCGSVGFVPYVHMQTSLGVGFGVGWNYFTKNGFSLEFESVTGIVDYRKMDLGLPAIASIPVTVFTTEPFYYMMNDGLKPALHLLLRIGFPLASK